MKKGVLFFLILFPALAWAQFPAPTSFQITVNYIMLGESDWCDNHLVQGPDYCNIFSWEAPDTTNTPATLTGYRIYKDSVFFLATSNTGADTTGGYMASFYVTAVYVDPVGESEPSNVVVIGDLPMAAGEIEENNRIDIGFDLSQQVLIIAGAINARALWVYDMRGAQVLNTKVISTYQSLEGLSPGRYAVVVQDKYGGMHCKLVVMGF